MAGASKGPQIGAIADELGGLPDGAIAILDEERQPLHLARPPVVAALRYLLSTVAVDGEVGLPATLALTAAMRGEGVTYVSRSLAAVTAYDTEDTVVLADLNWRNPPPTGDAPTRRRRRSRPAATASNTDEGPTLIDVVESEVPLDEAIRPTSNPRLSFIAPGILPIARRNAVAASRALESAIAELSDRYKHVILDLPPVLASGDAIRLSFLADAAALVVRQGVTSTQQVETALEALRATPQLGVILNRSSSQVPRRLRRLVGA
ncbi:MAG: hypothetical protein ACK5OX_17890 [Desertimonas sp.]